MGGRVARTGRSRGSGIPSPALSGARRLSSRGWGKSAREVQSPEAWTREDAPPRRCRRPFGVETVRSRGSGAVRDFDGRVPTPGSRSRDNVTDPLAVRSRPGGRAEEGLAPRSPAQALSRSDPGLKGRSAVSRVGCRGDGASLPRNKGSASARSPRRTLNIRGDVIFPLPSFPLDPVRT